MRRSCACGRRIKDLQKGITDILVAIGKIETVIKQLGSMANKRDSTEKLSMEAMQSTKAAHKLLDELSTEITDLTKKAEDIQKEDETRIEDDKRQGRDDKRWIVCWDLAWWEREADERGNIYDYLE